jgi:hypothetical protein
MIKWKRLEEAPDYYISNRGEILSKRVEGKEKVLSTHTNKVTGYTQICLITSDKGRKPKKDTFTLHRLVAEYFVDNPNGYDRIHHKDHNKSNNHYWNLEWVTQEQNIHEYYLSDEKNKPRNMKAVEVWSVEGDYIDTYPSVNKAAREIKVSPTTIWRQLIGEVKNPEKFIVKYAEEK